ncbi:MAG TPA: aminopeptidase P family protein [Candidatus Acidoferrales bacterium]|nr:aminopeptidase P family protein [Candidatus Acidoferrales bacterium]
MPLQFSHRLRRLRAELRRAHAATLLVSHRPNIFYLTGFTGDNGMLLVSGGHATLFTDPRFDAQAAGECRASGVRVKITRKPLAQAVGEQLARLPRSATTLFEEDRLTVAQLRTARTPARCGCRWKAAQGLVEALREVKDSEELTRMRGAARIGSQVMQSAIKAAHAGMRETDLAAEIEYRMRRQGAEGPSFETIVASGVRAALPHGRASSKRLKEKDLVVLDLGVILRGYCSDLTRTIHIGRASPEVRRWYQAVLEAQTAGREAVKGGVAASEVDRAVRSVLRREGLERYFIHSTGHGLGIEVHERPTLRMNQTAALQTGSVVTIEPGIYLPGRGGIRIEDDVLVLAGGRETLTSAPRELIEV